MAKKKAVKTPEGITFKRTPKGINVTISENGRIIAVLRGYNNIRNMQKGLTALSRALAKARAFPEDVFTATDLTPRPKK